jgi:hypothetical protein
MLDKILFKFSTLFLLIISILFLFTQIAIASDYTPQLIIGDGKSGRVFSQWKQLIDEKQVQNVTIRLQKRAGGNDTFVNLRFGRGDTFENGRRVYLTDTSMQTVTWNVAAAPNGQELVLNAYNGEVYVESVRINYDSIENENDKIPTSLKPTNETSHKGSVDENIAYSRCRDARIRRPQIDIGRVRSSGGMLSSKYRLEGSIYGNCIEEAGYFENGRMKEEMSFPLDDRYQRQEFRVQVRSGMRGEIRAYTTDGRIEVIDVDEQIKDNQSGLF